MPVKRKPFATLDESQRQAAAAKFSDQVVEELVRALSDVARKKGWRRRDIATISGLHESAVSRILNGRRPNPTIETIALLAHAMGKRPVILLHDIWSE